MKKFKQVFFITASFIIMISAAGISQTKNDAVTAYNDGAQLIKSDPQGAMEAFNKCIELCNAVGAEADETKVLAETRLPSLQYKIAMESYKEKKLTEAIEKFEKAGEMAGKYKNDQILAKTKKVIPQLYMVVGNSLMKQDPQKALENLDKALQLDPNMAKAYLSKGLIYKGLGDEANMEEALSKTIETGYAHNDIKTAKKAEQVMETFYFNKAVKAVQTGNTDEAQTGFNKTVELGTKNPTVYYQLGKIHNSKKEYDLAVKSLKRALEFEKGGSEEKAGIYFEMGNAYLGAGDSTKACNSYKKALFGNYVESAKYQIEQVLKCDK